MKSYLDLAGIVSRRRQSHMTRLCIVLAVFLVTAIFGMADMELNSQRLQAIQQYGNWHAQIRGLTAEEGELVAARPEVQRAAWYDAVNVDLDQDYTIGGERVAICGMDEGWLAIFPGAVYLEGGYPSEPGTVSLTQNAHTLLGVSLGDPVTLTLPDGRAETLLVTGFIGDTSQMLKQDSAGVLMNLADYRRCVPEAAPELYVRLTTFCDMQGVFREIQADFGIAGEDIGKNPKLMGLTGQSDNDFMQMLYRAAAILSGVVVVSAVLMMSGSLNSSVAQRTEFFGLLRCLGATPKQVRKYVRREALGWCRTAIPLGLLAGTAVIWLLCEILRALTPTYFNGLPRLGISPAALASGAAVGLLTVLLAARTPAKRAAKASPLAVVSGNAGTVQAAKSAASTRFFRVETALGVHHATGSRRNFLLMAGSFAFSIVLFLAFVAVSDFMDHAIKPVHPSTPDFSVVSPDESCSLPASLTEEIAALPMVKRVYGRGFAYDLQGECGGAPVTATLISYESNQFEWARQARIDGDFREAEAGRGLLLAYNSGEVEGGGRVHTGDFITLNGYALPISGTVSWSPYDLTPGSETLFCSEALFRQLTGEDGLTVIDVQFRAGDTDEAVARVRELAGDGVNFSDRRLSNREARGAYYAFALFVYGFLAVVTLIAVVHIVNSIALSVSARMRQYGAMRAIGMETGQLTRMVAAEALTYALGGAVFGSALGLPLNWLLFSQMVSFQWGDPWSVPWKALAAILLALLAAVGLAVAAPARRIREMSVTDTIAAD